MASKMIEMNADTKKRRIKQMISIIVTIIAAGLVILSGILKLTGSPRIVRQLNEVGMGRFIILLACLEFLFTALFIIPRTTRIGFILLSCYFAGAIATDLSHRENIMSAAIRLMFVWIAAF